MDLSLLNPEQAQAVLHKEGPLLVLAAAGTGKTRVITYRIARLIEEGVPPQRILAVTFTNKAAEEMRQRVESLAPGRGSAVWIHTFHGFCAKLLRQHYEMAKVSRYFTIYDQSDQKRLIADAMKECGFEREAAKASMYASIISRAKDDLLDAGSYAIYAATTIDASRKIAAQIYSVYQKKIESAGGVDFGDLLLKVCSLLKEHPSIREYYQEHFLHILVDEYQDTNHAQYIITKTLAAKHKNLCVVGDDDQCLPADARVMTAKGLIKIKDIREGDEVIGGSGWGKSALMPVSKVVARPFEGPLVRVRLRSGQILSATPNHIFFARLDPIRGMHYVYLMWKKDKGYRVGVTSGMRSYKEGVLKNGIAMRANGEVADAAWILRACRDPIEARYYEQYYSMRYGIPTMVFHARGRRMAMGQEWIDKLFRDTDTTLGAERLMHELRLDRRFPHHRPQAVIRGQSHRKYIWFTVFGDPRPHTLKPWHEHRIQLVTSDKTLRQKAERNFPVRGGQRGTWRIETSRKDYDEGLDLVKAICSLDGLEAVSRARLTPGKAFHFMPASHLRPGMIVPLLKDGGVIEDEIESIETVPYKGKVYDLSVPNLRNFAAEGVLVHNSVYSWRGADIRNILEFERDFKETGVVTLEQNYRSTKPILEAAGRVINNNGRRKSKTLWTKRQGGTAVRVQELIDEREEASWVVRKIEEEKKSGHPLSSFAIFYRTNAQSRSFEEALRREGIPYRLIGAMRFYQRQEIKDALAYARILLNPRDEISLLRVVNVPPRGIGKTSLERLKAYADLKGLNAEESFRSADQIASLTPSCRKSLSDLNHFFDKLRADLPNLSAWQAMARILDESRYLSWLEEESETDIEAASRLANVQELLSSVKEYEERRQSRGGSPLSLGEYLEEISLQTDRETTDATSDSVTLMTIHLAKGLEYPVVFLTGLEEGLFPIGSGNSSKEELEEERRLCYVGMTRAKEMLYLTHASSRRVFGQTYSNIPSRFIMEAQLNGELSAERTRGYTAPQNSDRTPSSSVDAPVVPAQRLGANLRIGSRVRHPLFGIGEVLEKLGSGETAKALVRFENGRTTKLVLRYAPLEIL